jgi:hypothetical protein
MKGSDAGSEAEDYRLKSKGRIQAKEAQLQHEQSRQTNAELVAKLQRARHAGRIADRTSN